MTNCLFNHCTLAEFALGPERSRLSAEERTAIHAHLTDCPRCRRAVAFFREAAEQPWPDAYNANDKRSSSECESPREPAASVEATHGSEEEVLPASLSGYAPVPPHDNVSPAALAVSCRNVETRWRGAWATMLAEEARAEERERARRAAIRETRRWRWRALALGGAAVLLIGVLAAVWPVRPATPEPSNERRDSLAAVSVMATDDGDDTRGSLTSWRSLDGVSDGTGGQTMPATFIPLESTRREAWTEQVRRATTPEMALAVLEDWREALGRSPRLPERDLVEAVALAEGLVWRAKDTPTEAAAYLYVARRQAELGHATAWRDALFSYVLRVGDQARRASIAAGDPRAATEWLGRRAEAAAYYNEALRLYHEKDYAGSVAIAGRLLALYGDTAKAYEAQIVAARCHIEARQPSGAIDAYLAIVRRCPDELFARTSAKALLEMLGLARRGDDGIELARELRRRFRDDEFRTYALYREGDWLRRKGPPYYLQAIAVFREVVAIAPASEEAREADRWIRRLRRDALEGLRPEAGRL